MEEEVGGPLLSTHIDVSALSNGGLLSDFPVSTSTALRSETVTTNEVLTNGIIIETNKGLQWLSLADALTLGVGELNLSVEDFQNVAAQLLHRSTATIGENVPSSDDEDRPVQSFGCKNSSLESISEASEDCDDLPKADGCQIKVPKGFSISLCNKNALKTKLKALPSSDSSSLTVSESTGTNSDSSVQSVPLFLPQVKRKGGWPKGRKRKPELANRPPKAPSTGYVYYLNEKRKQPEFRNIPFTEVTKILGNEWSGLSLENKKEYLERAELDKKRYRDELRIYRNSETYRSYLKRRRIRSYKNDGTEESDVTDATDDIDDEDNEELYCRACDQWFTTLHNKKEHLYGKQHFQIISQKANTSFSLDDSSLDGTAVPSPRLAANPALPAVPDAIAQLFSNVAEREREIKILQERQRLLSTTNKKILKELQDLKQSRIRTQRFLSNLKEEQFSIEKAICDLWEVPALVLKDDM